MQLLAILNKVQKEYPKYHVSFIGRKAINIETNFLDKYNDKICFYIVEEDRHKEKYKITDDGYLYNGTGFLDQQCPFTIAKDRSVSVNCTKINLFETVKTYINYLNKHFKELEVSNNATN